MASDVSLGSRVRFAELRWTAPSPRKSRARAEVEEPSDFSHVRNGRVPGVKRSNGVVSHRLSAGGCERLNP